MNRGFLTSLILFFNSTNSYGQSRHTCTIVTDSSAAFSPISQYSSNPSLSQIDSRRIALLKFLRADHTDKALYVGEVSDEKKWFVCNHFATQFFLRSSEYAVGANFLELEEKTPIRYLKESLADPDRLPVFYVGLDQKGTGLSHAMNAIYLGTSKDSFSDLSKYLFIEPETDDVFLNPDQLLNHYFGKSISLEVDLGIVIPSHLGHTLDGDIQYLNDPVVEYHCVTEKQVLR